MLLGAVPPDAFQHWYYLAVAALGALIAFFLTKPTPRIDRPVLILDAIGLSLFCVVGAQKALAYGLDPIPAILLGGITAVGGGTLRDVLTGQVPSILTSGLYAIPALVGAAITVLVPVSTVMEIPLGVIAAVVCFGIRMVGIRFNLNAPVARRHRRSGPK